MARIVKIAKYVQVPEPGGFLPRPLRRAPAKPPALYLLQLRAKSLPQFAPRRLTITVTPPINPDVRPESIKIKHT